MRHSLQRVLILTIAMIASAIPLASSAHDVRYWVWQRDDPLDEQELAELEAQKIDTEQKRDRAFESAASRVSFLTELGAKGDGFL
jgi:cell division protein FtsL